MCACKVSEALLTSADGQKHLKTLWGVATSDRGDKLDFSQLMTEEWREEEL